MKKFFTLTAVVLSAMTMSAATIFGPFTLTAENNVQNQENAVNGGTAIVTTVFPTGSSNELTIDGWTFYKFNSSSAIKCTLADDATFAVGDSIYVTVAANASSNKNCGVKLNNSITVAGTIPGGQTATFGYEVVAEDGIAGANFFTIYRSSSDSKFGRVWVERPGEVIPSTDPVDTVIVKGPTEGFVGIPVTLTATAAKADTIWWTDQSGIVQESLNGVFTFTPSVAGEVTYTAWAENQYNASPVTNGHTITIAAKLCGELIKATHVNKNTATVTGALGGTADKNTQDNGKLGSNGHYFGIRLASGDFMPGDSITIIASVLNGGNVATIYSDKGNNLLATVDFDAESLTATYTLTQSVSAIYVYRTSSACNPNIESIAVNRPCEASNNANVAEVRVNDVVVEPEGANGTLYSYTLSATYSEPTVSIALTLAHPLATIKYGLANPYSMSTPDAGSSRGQAFTIIAEDGVTEKTITVNVSKADALSNDWMLSALSIDGYTLDPAFDPEINSYTITKPYGAANPEESAIHATPRHPGAHIDHITINPTNILILVVAEDGESSNGYAIDILEAPAKKDLLEASFSNGVHGFILNGNIDVPYLAGTEEPTFVSARFWNADGEPTAEIVEGNLVVTGIDGLTASYTINYAPVTPMSVTNEEITFENVPSYIYSVYGWDSSKGVKFSKDVEDADNHRISEGKDRIYIALPAGREVILTSGTQARPIKVTVNGVVNESVTKTAASGETITIALNADQDNLVGIESNNNNGDAGFTKMKMNGWPTDISNAETEVKAVKLIENGQLMIIKNGVKYNAQGSVVK